MRSCPPRVLAILALLTLLSASGAAFYNIPLSNAEMSDYAAGVALDWTSFTTGTPLPPELEFYADSGNYRTAPYAQGIRGIDTVMALGDRFGAGVYRQISAAVGDVVMLVGFQDLFDSYYQPPPAARYAHFFGIDPQGAATPPAPFEMGGVRWMGENQWFYNNMPGNSTQVGGMHRCIAAWPARSGQVSIWSGVFVYAEAPTSTHPTVFDTDSFMLFGFDNSARNSLQNPGFETVHNLTPGCSSDDIHRITLPAYWVPIGGGFGQKESFYTDGSAKRTGSAGLRIYNQRGCLTRGVMQRVRVPAGTINATLSAWVRANRSSGAIARIGIDPTGGDDINSTGIIWSYYSLTDASWQQISVTADPDGPVVTFFLAMHNAPGTTGNIHYADFDDLSLAFQQDETPPEPFSVIAQSPWQLTSYLSAAITPEPLDPESGIASVDYAIGITPGGQEVRGFTPCPNHKRVEAYGLYLTPGQTYYITVRAANGAGLNTTRTSGPIVCAAEQCYLAGYEVTVTGTFKFKVASGGQTVWKSVPFACVQQANRMNAVRVVLGSAQNSPAEVRSLQPGDLVTVSGSCTLMDGQRTVGWITEDGTAVDVTVTKAGESPHPVRPFAMCVRDLGGRTDGSKTGPTGGLGPNNVGLLIRTAGKVNLVDTDERGVTVLYVDDGSKAACGPSVGCKVYAPGFSADVGDLLIITGASCIEQYDPTPGVPGDETYIRVLMPREIEPALP